MTSPDDPLGRKDLERLIVPSKELEEAISNRRAYEAMLGGIRDWVQDRQHALDLMEPALEQFRRMEATRQLIEPPAHLQVMAEQNQLLREIERQNEERQRLLDSITQPPIFDAQATLQPFSGVEQYIKSSLFELLERTSTLSPDAVSFRELGTQFQRYRDVIDLYLGEVKSPDSDVIWRTITDSVTEALVTQPESVKEPEAGPDAAVQYAVGSFRGTVTQLPDEWRTPSTLLNIDRKSVV